MVGAGRHSGLRDAGLSPRLRTAVIVFEVTQEANGGYCAECLTLSIFTQGDTCDELREHVREVVQADGELPCRADGEQ
ncbi:MAG: hypothetical protein IPM24_11325 [Bryobacterales bacterium]|nr:hypothetical protein [Bryobacterales bacterium]